jgi:hypothetical protein
MRENINHRSSEGTFLISTPGSASIYQWIEAKATAITTWAVNRPDHRTSRGVKNADNPVPIMPAPKTPVARPRRAGSNQLFTKGMPAANTVPATPRKKPNANNSVVCV